MYKEILLYFTQLLWGIFSILAGIRYWTMPPFFRIPVSKTGKLVYKIVYCTLGMIVIYSAIDLFITNVLCPNPNPTDVWPY